MVYGTIGTIGGLMQRGRGLIGAAQGAGARAVMWGLRNPALGWGAVGIGALGLAATGRSVEGAAYGGAMGAGAGLGGAMSINYVGRGFGGSMGLMSGGRAAARKFGLIGAGAGALIGATMDSNRGVNRFRGF